MSTLNTPDQPAAAGAPVAAVADPAPLGLLGFGFTTLMLSLVNTGTFKVAEGASLVLSLALFYGGGAQLLAGMWEFRRGNTLGATAFSTFGAFWIIIWYWFNHFNAAGSSNAVGWFFLGWAIVTAIFTLASLRTTHALLAVLFFLTITFLFLALGQWQAKGMFNPLNDPTLTKVGGWLGVVTGLLAWYTAAGHVVNATHQRELLPLNLKR